MFSARGCVPDLCHRECTGKYCPKGQYWYVHSREQGVYWIIWSLKIKSFNIIPVASGYKEIHPYSAMNIDSVKINTSLIMMRESIVPLVSSACGLYLARHLSALYYINIEYWPFQKSHLQSHQFFSRFCWVGFGTIPSFIDVIRGNCFNFIKSVRSLFDHHSDSLMWRLAQCCRWIQPGQRFKVIHSFALEEKLCRDTCCSWRISNSWGERSCWQGRTLET